MNNFAPKPASMTGFAHVFAKSRDLAILRRKPVMDAICVESCWHFPAPGAAPAVSRAGDE
ncbi:MAG: hypothetical protein JSS05_10805 [Proteobacteria bacterium]|nr:hypothetical protein [Pseudomonadota bacterium]